LAVAWQILISALSGFVLGFLANAAVAALPRPRFSYDAVVDDPDPRGWKFVSVDVTNKRRRGLLHFLDKTAHLCTAQIEFLDVKTRALLIDPMDARWPTFQAEPMIAGVLDVGMAVIPHRETIPPGERASVNVAVKFVGEDDCWGFNNRSYAHGGKTAEQRLGCKCALVQVVVNFEGKPYRSPEFILENPDPSASSFALVKRQRSPYGARSCRGLLERRHREPHLFTARSRCVQSSPRFDLVEE
jgi:hypothetical protein